MSSVQECKNCFQRAAVRRAFTNKWLPTTAWTHAIEQTTSQVYTNKTVSKAINWIRENAHSKFVHNAKEYVIHYHRRFIRDKHIHFYWVSSNTRDPPYPTSDALFWQKQYDHSETRFKPRETKKRACRESSNKQHDEPKCNTHHDDECESNKKQRVDENKPTYLNINVKQARRIELQSKNAHGNSPELMVNGSNNNAGANTNANVDDTMLTTSRKMMMLREAWANMYPTLPFPNELLVQVNQESTPVCNNDESKRPAAMSGRYHVRDIRLPGGNLVQEVPNNYELVSVAEMAKYKGERVIVRAMKSLLNSKRCQVCTSPRSQLLHAAFASAYPTVPTEQQQVLSAIARITFMLDIKAQAGALDAKHDALFDNLIDIGIICNVSPSARSIDSWVDNLAVIQGMIAAEEMRKATKVFLQSDKAPDGSEAKILTWYDNTNSTVHEFHAGLEGSGKKSDDIADGIDHTLTHTFGLTSDHFKLAGIVEDSGAGTPESLMAAIERRNRALDTARAESCGLHDLQSVLRLPIEYYMGVGGIDNQNAVLCEHAVYDLFKVFTELGNWKRIGWLCA